MPSNLISLQLLSNLLHVVFYLILGGEMPNIFDSLTSGQNNGFQLQSRAPYSRVVKQPSFQRAVTQVQKTLREPSKVLVDVTHRQSSRDHIRICTCASTNSRHH